MGLKEWIEAVAATVFIVIGGMAMGWYKILKETNTLLKEQNEQLQADNKMWQQKHLENREAIAKLQAQIDTIKDVPLNEIANHMKEQTILVKSVIEFMQSQRKVKE